jgi:two-component system cell cycle sensor histidine kinase/response regulator CckA
LISLACLEGRLVAGGAKGSKKTTRGSEIDFDLLLKCFPGIIYQYATIDEGPVLLRGDLEELTGHPAGELSGPRGWWRAVHPDDMALIEGAVASALSGESPVGDIRFRIVRKNGSVRWVRNVFCQMPSTGDKPLFQGIVYDVNDATLAERDRVERHEMLDGIMRVVPAGIGVVIDRVFTEVNDRFCRMLGYSREELLGKSARMIYPTDEDFEYVGREKYDQIKATGTGSVETRFMRKDGSILEIHLSSTLLDPADSSNGVAFTALDITSRKAAERTVAENARFLAGVFSSVQDGISILDKDLRIVRTNPTMEQWYSHAMPLEGKLCFKAYHSSGRQCAICPSRRALETGLAQQEVVPLSDPDGSVTGWLDLYSYPLIDRESGEVTGVIEYVRNITARVKAESDLRHDRDLLRSIAEASPVGIAVMNADGMITLVNSALELAMGIPRDRLIGIDCTHPGWKFMNPDGSAMAVEEMAFTRVLRTHEPVHDSLHLLELKKGKALFNVNAAPLFDQGGRLEGVVSTIQDVTEKAAAQDALERSEQFSRTLIDESPIGISVRDPHGRLLLCNRAWQRIWAMPDDAVRKDLETRRDTLRLDERDGYLSQWAAEVRKVYETGGVLHIPDLKTKARRRGAAKFVSQHFYAITNAAGSVERVVILTEDVSQKKSAENALKESEERYRALAEAAQDLIFVVDREDRISYVNNNGAKAFGGAQADLIGRLRSSIFTKAVAEQQEKSLQTVFSTGEPYYHETATDFPGRTLWLGTWLTPLRDSSGTVSSVLGVSRDITLRKLSEEKERSLQEQLSHVQRMESVGRLAGGVAHDFNNLLTVILGHLELLLADLPPYDTPLRSSLSEIKGAAERASNLTGQLLAFGRRQMLSMKPLNLNELILGFSGILRRLIGEDIQVVTKLGEDAEPVSADQSQMEQVLMNLAVNARDAMPLGGRLTIETSSAEFGSGEAGKALEVRPGRYSALFVGDTGIGMDQVTLGRIFDPFFTTKEVGKGTGLGLSTVYGIVKQHGGHIAVESEPGRGSTFRIYLPVAEAGSGPAEELPPTDQVRIQSKTVLVVEDDVAVRQLVCRMLRDAGYDAIECIDPLQAASIAESTARLDLVVTDVVMPGLSGSQVSEQVTAVRPDVRILFISGYTGEVLAHYGVSDKGVGFLQKPFTTQAFLQKVREVLS